MPSGSRGRDAAGRCAIDGKVRLDHGEGGAATQRLVREIFAARFRPPEPLDDAAVLPAAAVAAGARLALTTDAFVVRPPFFPGGDIGKLAVVGTVNDLAVSGAEPLALTAAFILEEGLDLRDLERVVDGMAGAAAAVPVRVVAGDTKVVGRGEADRIFVATTGLGLVPPGRDLRSDAVRPGDRVLISGPVGDHGAAVLAARGDLGIASTVRSDCACVLPLVRALLASAPHARCLRDPTRGGLATTVHELAASSRLTVVLDERAIPVRPEVRRTCDLVGMDPLYLACEGRLIAVVPPEEADAALAALRGAPDGAAAALAGTAEPLGRFGNVLLRTAAGGTRPMAPLEGAQLPRIC
ncbi:MAG: hydrogenase expression/formation protein HypE [Deltaproteobacteria bacterium]|nr:hydrogenase expression/formation protein HypE [Deltaproteobacteria bacterium]